MKHTRRTLVGVLAVLTLGSLPGAARAQVPGSVIAIGVPSVGVPSGGQVVAETDIPATFHGELVVSFRGDAAAGCATYGLCGYTGTVIVRPSGGDLGVVSYRVRHRTVRQAVLYVEPPEVGNVTSAHVQRSAPGGLGGTCADAGSAAFGAASSATIRGRKLAIRLLAPGGSLLQTRCAGPLDGDLAGAGPAVMIPLARAVHGRTALDLSGTRAFAAHGFAGTISSTLMMRLGKPHTQTKSSGSGFPPGVKLERIRTVTQPLSLVHAGGQLTAAVQGTNDPILCRLLDSCGLSGSLSLDLSSSRIDAEIVAVGPAIRPYGDFLTALGLGHGGRSHGIGVGVIASWSGDVRAAVSQDGTTCTGTAPMGALTAILGSPFGSFGGFGPSGGSGGFSGSWRTRCPGPLLSNGANELAASFGSGELSGRRVVIDLRARASLTDDGYVVTPHGRVSVVLRRGRIHQQVSVQPVP